MNRYLTEIRYPITFRERDAEQLGKHILHRHSVELVGMRRVGISNFLRFFLYREDVVKTYIHASQKHLFIPVDLNDLYERELGTFWRLTLKRTVDIINQNPDLEEFRDQANETYKSVDRNDIFGLMDAIRDLIIELVQNEFIPTIFFLRFDRLQDVITSEFFRNLQGMIDATNQKLAYVFTSYRPLNAIRPDVFDKQSLLSFSHDLYLKPASEQDMETILTSLEQKYDIGLSEQMKTAAISYATGHVQYLHLMMFLLNEHPKLREMSPEAFFDSAAKDERIILQSEELYDALYDHEQHILLGLLSKDISAEQATHEAGYLFDAGYLYQDKNMAFHPFNPFFTSFLETYLSKKTSPSQSNLTKKEQLLYEILKEKQGEICERDDIVRYVWSECSEVGVSDWAVDRLVSRLRTKLRDIEQNAKIKTVKTRGFMLV
jgi:DNA-binding winged helix-turn-helix (wHTH) protein